MLSWYWVMSTALPALCLQDSVRRGITQTAMSLLKGPPPSPGGLGPHSLPWDTKFHVSRAWRAIPYLGLQVT